MTVTETAAELRFESPGPGSWLLDPLHFPRPVTRYWAETHPEPFLRGTHDFAVNYGMLVDGLENAYVNGFVFRQTRPVPDEVSQRFQRAAQVFEQKLWREQLREWDEVRKPAAMATHLEIQAVEPERLFDESMVGKLRAAELGSRPTVE